MDKYIIRVVVYRKEDNSVVDHLVTDLTYMNLSGYEIEEFVEATVEEDRGKLMFETEEGEDE